MPAYRASRPNQIRDPAMRRYLSDNPLAHGGDFFKKSGGRKRRYISEAGSMNLTLRSTQAKGEWSFRTQKNWNTINALTNKFAARFKVEVIRVSNVGNHLHFHVWFPVLKSYVKFIRALTAAIAMAITGLSRWSKSPMKKFWDQRPFTRPIQGAIQFLHYDEYLDLNDLEGEGYPRVAARALMKLRKLFRGGIDLTKWRPA